MPRRYVITAVCVALVLLCAGLLFPAVQKVREASSRMVCHSHFKGLALALHMYAEGNPRRTRDGRPACDAFPAGTVAHDTLPPEQRWSLYIPLLASWSDIDRDNVIKTADLTRGPSDPRNAKPANARIRYFTCPSSGECVRGDYGEEWKSPSPLTHYVGVAGVGADAAALALEHPRAGVFGHDRRTAIPDDIPDGASNTLLIIETANGPGHWAYGGFATVRAFEPDAAPYLGPGRPFGGFHNGGPVLFGERAHTCTAAMADGSVRSLRSETAAEVLEALATVGGKEELPNW